MTVKKTWCVVSLAIGIGFHWFGISSQAQSEEKFKARLAPAPALGITPAAVAGIGSASATLTGRKLAVTGSFERMASPATVARIYTGPVTGVRGSVISDLTVSKAANGTSGTIAGNLDLTPEQVDALRKGRLYIQIHSEGVPTGHLLGWLLK
jgi:hypothetical protein